MCDGALDSALGCPYFGLVAAANTAANPSSDSTPCSKYLSNSKDLDNKWYVEVLILPCRTCSSNSSLK